MRRRETSFGRGAPDCSRLEEDFPALFREASLSCASPAESSGNVLSIRTSSPPLQSWKNNRLHARGAPPWLGGTHECRPRQIQRSRSGKCHDIKGRYGTARLPEADQCSPRPQAFHTVLKGGLANRVVHHIEPGTLRDRLTSSTTFTSVYRMMWSAPALRASTSFLVRAHSAEDDRAGSFRHLHEQQSHPSGRSVHEAPGSLFKNEGAVAR